MYIGSHYKIVEFLRWTRRDIYFLLVLATIPTVLYKVLGFTWIAIPWVPVSLVGTAAAFIVGFKNTQTYNRLWEARQIWGSIVNTSRAWGIMCRDFVKADHSVKQALINRHSLRNALQHQSTQSFHDYLFMARKTGDQLININCFCMLVHWTFKYNKYNAFLFHCRQTFVMIHIR